MKFAFCLFKYFPFGGLQRDFLRIASLCHQRGATIDVFTTAWQGEPVSWLTVHIIPVRGLQNHTRNRHFINQVRPKLVLYDLVVGFNKMPGLDIYYAADSCYQAKVAERHFWHRLIPRYRTNLMYEKAVFDANVQNTILLLSKKQQIEFETYYQTPSNRFCLLPPGIAKDRMLPGNANETRERVRQSLKIKSNEWLLLFVGSGFKTKGLDRALLGLASLVPSLKNRTYLYIIGKDRITAFESLAKKLKIASQVKFLGGRDDIPQFLLAADLLVHPAYHENTGTVLLEALVAGLPVLTTDRCGYANYIHEANCGVVLPSPFQQHQFNQTLGEMLLSKDRPMWRNNALSFSKTADIYEMTDRATAVIEKIALQKNLMVSFDKMMSFQGQVYREQNGRRTQRIQWEGNTYFIKQHYGVGWKEIFKNILHLKRPVLGANNEWRALNRLKELKILVPDVMMYGCRGKNPAKQQSFLVMSDLKNTISLEDYCKQGSQHTPLFSFKRRLLNEIARIARTLHLNGINHRDFYLCHFLLDLDNIDQCKLYLIDLHRAEIRKRTPLRWVIKDLAGLYFSSKTYALTTRDWLRFIKEYRNKSIRDIIVGELNFWQKVKKRGDKLFKREKEYTNMENALSS